MGSPATSARPGRSDPVEFRRMVAHGAHGDAMDAFTKTSIYSHDNLRDSIRQASYAILNTRIQPTEIVHDWSPLRTLAECVARLGIVACMGMVSTKSERNKS